MSPGQRVTFDNKGILYADGEVVRNSEPNLAKLQKLIEEDKQNGYDLREQVQEFQCKTLVEEFEALIKEHERVMDHFKDGE
jgi:hypothetical protein